MKRKWLMVFLCLCAVTVAGCGKKEETADSTVATAVTEENVSADKTESSELEDIGLPAEAGNYEKEALPDFITDLVKAEDTSYENPAPVGTWVEIGADDSPVYTNLDYDITKALYIRVNKVTRMSDDPDYVNDFLDVYEAENEGDNEFSELGRKVYTYPESNFYLVDYELYIPDHFADKDLWIPQDHAVIDSSGDSITQVHGVRALTVSEDTDATTYPGRHITGKGYFNLLSQKEDTDLGVCRWEIPSMPDGVASTLVNNPNYKPGAASYSDGAPYIYVYSKELPESMDAYLALVADEEADTTADGETAEEPET